MKIFIRYFIVCFFLLIQVKSIHAQTFLSIDSDASVYIQAKTNISFDSLLLTPSSDVLMRPTDITKSATLMHTATGIHINRVYQFSQPVAAYSGNIDFGYTDNELNGLDENSLVLNAFNNNSWTAFLDSVSHDAIDNYVTTSGLSNISLDELTLTSISGVLPLRWISVNATRENSFTVINWITAQEINCKYYQVQRSTNTVTWQNIGSTVKADNHNSFNYYNVKDASYLYGSAYYRIVLTDMNGEVGYSIVMSVRDMSQNTVVVFPNPAVNTVNVRVGATSIIKRIKVFDTSGKLVMAKEGSNNNVYEFDVSTLASGFYMMDIETNNGNLSKGFVK